MKNYANIFIPVILIIFFIFIVRADAQVFEQNGMMYSDPAMIIDDGIPGLSDFAYSAGNDWDPLPFFQSDFRVNELAGEYGAEQWYPNIAIDGSGNYALAWVDKRNGEREIYAQFFDKQGNRIGENILVSHEPNRWNSAPAIACNAGGDFIVAWAQDSDQILAQRFSQDGRKIGDNFQLNRIQRINTNFPSIAVTDNGSFLAVWTQDAGATPGYNTYARLFDPQSNPVGDEIMVNDINGQGSSSIGSGKRVAVDGYGKFVVVWSENFTGRSRIYLQNIDSNGNKIGTNITVSDTSENSDHLFPEISATKDGHYLIIWQNNGISGRIYHNDGYFLTEQIEIYDSENWWSEGSVASDRENKFLILVSLGNPLKCQQISTTGEILSNMTNLPLGIANSVYIRDPVISNIHDQHFYTAFMQYRINDTDCLLQKYTVDYSPLNDLIKVHDDLYSSRQSDPLVYYNDQGESIILWKDRRNGRYDLYAQIYDKSYNPIGQNIKINDIDSGHWFLQHREVKSFSDGTFLVAFTGSDNIYDSNIYLQRIDGQGKKIGSNKLIKALYSIYDISLAINDRDQVLLCWFNSKYDYPNARVKTLNKNLSTILSERTLIQKEQKYRQLHFTVSINDSFNIFTSWRHYDKERQRPGDKILGLLYDERGRTISDTIIIGEISMYESSYDMHNFLDSGGNFVAACLTSQGLRIYRNYNDEKNHTLFTLIANGSYNSQGPRITRFKNNKIYLTWTVRQDVYGCYINDNIQEVYLNKLHHFESFERYWDDYMTANSSDINDGKIFFAYASNREGGTGYDIWANVQSDESYDFDYELFRPPVKDDVLYENYPNPFNAKTKISYRIYSYHQVKIEIFDILGRKVKVLVDKPHEAGFYTVEFDGSDLTTGLYFCKMEAFRTKVIKLLLVK